MLESWRWFGDYDAIPLSYIRQAGAQGVVTALHEVPKRGWSADVPRVWVCGTPAHAGGRTTAIRAANCAAFCAFTPLYESLPKSNSARNRKENNDTTRANSTRTPPCCSCRNERPLCRKRAWISSRRLIGQKSAMYQRRPWSPMSHRCRTASGCRPAETEW